MPYTPLRSNLILFFQALTVIFMAISLCAYNIHGDDPDPELQMAIKMNELLHTLYTTRYIAPRNRIPISTDWRLRVLEAYEDKDFVSLMRMTKAQFYTLVDLIKDDPVFIPKGNKSQMPIREQLKICLYRLGVPAMLRREIKTWYRETFGLPQCIDAVDGIHFPYDYAPHLDPDAWNTYKC
ncbi:hypothetical protein BGX23_006875 [Mortierella sp. AD031]|nr:hypothetical protein BGX23_006875 [Mortierella sp. AD031]